MAPKKALVFAVIKTPSLRGSLVLDQGLVIFALKRKFTQPCSTKTEKYGLIVFNVKGSLSLFVQTRT